MKRITIIGGGATGTLLAVNLIKQNTGEALAINVVEKQARVGRGVAYSAVTDFHLLNVPANKMGAFPDDLEHFYQWLTANGHDYAATDFVPRRLYGEYLREVFTDAIKNKNANVAVNLIDDEAVDILTDEADAQVILRSGEILYSDKVILAFGNFLPPHPKSKDRAFIDSQKYFRNPWKARLLEKIPASDDVFIIGTGLTAVDVFLSLHHRQHTGRIFLFSTRGLLPAVHELGFVYPSFDAELKGATKITDLLKTVRRHIAKAESDHSNWRAVIDSLRPHTQEIWQTLPVAEKRYFLQHLSRYWNVARHRMPPECSKLLDHLQAAGRLQIVKGWLKNIETAERFTITYKANGDEHKLSADTIVNCIGSESDFSKVDAPLVKSLIERGLIKPDPLKQGIDATPDGRTITKDGNASDTILTIGTALKGILWESTAIPEIRAQANKLAGSLLLSNFIR